MDVQDPKGFFSSLFDFSFKSFITSKIIRVLYILSLIGAGLTYLMMIIVGFQASAAVGVLNLLILGPIVFMLIAVYARVVLEIIMVIFNIAENVNNIAGQTKIQPDTSDEE